MASRKQAKRIQRIQRIQQSKRARWAKKAGAFESARMAALLAAESGNNRQFAHPATV